jgi:hypothetical protein
MIAKKGRDTMKEIDERIDILRYENGIAEHKMQETKKEMKTVLESDNESVVDCMMELSKEFNSAYFWRKRNMEELKVLQSIKRETKR